MRCAARVLVAAGAVLVAGCASGGGKHAAKTVRPVYPKEDPRAALKAALTALDRGQVSALLAHTYFDKPEQRTMLQHLAPQMGALDHVRGALQATFGNAGTLGDDPLPGLLEAIDNAVVRTEPPNLARVIPQPPTPPFTMIAEGGRWKLDFARSQPMPERPATKEELAAIDGQTRRIEQAAKDIRAHRYATVDEALAAVFPGRRGAAATRPGGIGGTATMPASTTRPGETSGSAEEFMNR
jgi:hypothetical protein